MLYFYGYILAGLVVAAFTYFAAEAAGNNNRFSEDVIYIRYGVMVLLWPVTLAGHIINLINQSG